MFPCTFSILSFCEVGSLCVPYCLAGFLGCSFVSRVPVRFIPRFFEPPEPQLFDQDRGHDGRRDGQDASKHAEGRAQNGEGTRSGSPPATATTVTTAAGCNDAVFCMINGSTKLPSICWMAT